MAENDWYSPTEEERLIALRKAMREARTCLDRLNVDSTETEMVSAIVDARSSVLDNLRNSRRELKEATGKKYIDDLDDSDIVLAATISSMNFDPDDLLTIVHPENLYSILTLVFAKFQVALGFASSISMEFEDNEDDLVRLVVEHYLKPIKRNP